ncbi:hypothetical protein [Amycolatopsis sp. NPDC051371]|uniref:hypothetical protein n=1 Tax=Amycolatopsis sp. NPDC051371 TaxID=3155800 RepID=UPI0034290DEB
MSYIKLEAHYTIHISGGVHIGAVNLTTVLAGDLTVDMPIPFLALTDTLAVFPSIEADGDTAMRIDFTHWSPLRYGAAGAARFPFALTSQELAVRVARAFDADPAVDWSDTRERIEAWLNAWLAANTARVSS